MSAERMIENAMQEQPILLLPLFMFVYFVKHLLSQVGAILSANALTTRLPH